MAAGAPRASGRGLDQGVLFGKPWTVVARSRTADGQRWRHAREIRGWRPSGELIAAARREIAEYGQPRSLGAALPAEMPETSAATDL